MRPLLGVVAGLVLWPTPQQRPLPHGWTDCSHGGEAYADTTRAVEGRHVLVLRAPRGRTVACARQGIDARPYRGRIVSLDGAVRGRSSSDGGIWLEAVGPTGARYSQRMIEDSVHQLSFVWDRYEASMIVPVDAETLYVGASAIGSDLGGGIIFVDALGFEDAPPPGSVLPSAPPPPPFPQPRATPRPVPVNLSFEE